MPTLPRFGLRVPQTPSVPGAKLLHLLNEADHWRSLHIHTYTHTNTNTQTQLKKCTCTALS